jgi:hypothetical protein
MTTMPNNADAPNAAMALCFHSEYHQRGVGDLHRWANCHTMKILLLLITVVSVLVTRSVAQEVGKVRLTLVSKECISGRQYVFEVVQAQIATLPIWHPESESPAPVSLKKACTIGRATLKAKYPQIEELEIANVSLNKVVGPEQPGCWYYILDYVGKQSGKSVPSCRFFAVVLMDGSSVEPVIVDPNKSDMR